MIAILPPRLYIKSKLYQKGVPKTISEEAVETELVDYNEAEAAMKIARKKYKTVKDLPQLKAKKRIADFLRGRGFDWDIVNQALDELFRGDD